MNNVFHYEMHGNVRFPYSYIHRERRKRPAVSGFPFAEVSSGSAEMLPIWHFHQESSRVVSHPSYSLPSTKQLEDLKIVHELSLLLLK